MRRLVLAIVVAGVALGACGGSKSAAPTTTTMATTQAPTTAPAPTLPPGVGPLCADATATVLEDAKALPDAKVSATTFDQPAFWKDFTASLDNCSSRIEWLTSAVAQDGSQYEANLAALFAYGCKKENFVSTAMGNIGAPTPISVACQNS